MKRDKEILPQFHSVLARGRHIWRRDNVNCKNWRSRANLAPHCGRFPHRTTALFTVLHTYCSHRKMCRKIILHRLHIVLARGRNSFQQDEFERRFNPHFLKQRGGGRRWRMLTAFVHHDLFLSYDTIGDQICNAGLEIQRFSRRVTRTTFLGGKTSNSIFSKSGIFSL